MAITNKPTVLVLARSFSSGLSVVRSLGVSGYPVDLIANNKNNSALLAASKYIREFIQVLPKKEEDDTDIVVALLRYAENKTEKIVLIPADKKMTAALDRNRDILAEHFIMPSMANGASFEEYGDKILQMKLADAAGITVPTEWILEPNEPVEIPEEITYPCICRPLGDVSLKKKRAVCSDHYELAEHIDFLRRRAPGCTIATREYYETDSVITVAGVCRDQEVYCSAYITSTNIAQHKDRSTLSGQLYPIDNLGETKEKIIRFLRSFHYTGIFNLKLRLDEDRIYFDKIMFNCGRQNHVYMKCGANLLDALVKALRGGEFIPENETLTEGVTFINEMTAWGDYVRGFISKKELNAILESVELKLIDDKDDPAPNRLFLASMRKAAFKGKLSRMKTRVKTFIKKKFFPSMRRMKYFMLRYPQSKKKNARDPLAEKPRVLVAGRNYCSNLCLARAFGQAGFDVEILRIFQVRPSKKNLLRFLKPDAYSKYVKAYHVCVSHKKSRLIVNKLISIADRERKMLLIPADDLVANITDEYLEKLLEYYVIPNVNNTPNAINRLMSKEAQKDLAEEAGLPIINSCVIKTDKGQFDIPETVKYPCFIKPNISKNGLKSKMRRCDSEEELREVLTDYSQKVDIEMLVQDFVEIGKEYSILGVSTKDGVVGPGFFGAEEGGHDSRRGVALTGKVIPTSRNQELIDDIIKFIETMNFEGLYDIDLIETKDGTMYFVEMNMRFGGSGYAITASDCNLPGMFAEYMLMGKPIDMNIKLEKPGKQFVSEKIMIEEYVGGYLTKKQMKELMDKSDIHFIMDKEDPKPYRHFKRYYPLASLMRHAVKRKAQKQLKLEQKQA